jgi:hypothetical protein
MELYGNGYQVSNVWHHALYCHAGTKYVTVHIVPCTICTIDGGKYDTGYETSCERYGVLVYHTL